MTSWAPVKWRAELPAAEFLFRMRVELQEFPVTRIYWWLRKNDRRQVHPTQGLDTVPLYIPHINKVYPTMSEDGSKTQISLSLFLSLSIIH